jgi:hypothetical protein
MIGCGDVGIEILDRRGEIAGQHLVGIVVQRQDGDALCVDGAAIQAVTDESQRVCDHGDLEAVLLNVFGVGAVHQTPPADELHPDKYAKK